MKRHWHLAALIALLFIFPAQAFAQLPTLIPREVLFGNPVKAGPQISPDGRMLSYLAPSDGVLNIWVRTIGKTDDHVITNDKKRPIRRYFWQQDSSHIIYLQDVGGNENWHVFQADLNTKEARDLTPFKDVAAQIVDVDPNFPNQILVGLNDRDKRWHDVYRVDLKTGKAELDTQNPGDVAGWETDNSMQVRAAQIALSDGGTEIRVRDDVKSPWRSFMKWGPDDTGGVTGFSPDNKRLWIISSVGANAGRLIEVDIATGKQKVLSEDKQYDVGSALVNPRSRKLEAVRYTRARSEWTLVDDSLKADFDALRKVRDGDFFIGSRTLDDKNWIITYVVDNGPVYWYVYNRPTRKATMLFSNQPALEKYTLAKVQPVSFKARDGMELYGYLTLPVGVAPKNLPMVMFVHGGPWARDAWGYNPYVQWLANRGYAVLQVNFRGSTGYGKNYINAGNREWAGKMHDDIIDGKRWAVQQGYADPERVAIMGGSYGGYATLVGLTFTPDEFAAGVDIVGPSNITTLLKTIPPYWEAGKAMFRRRVGDWEKEEDFLKSRSPLFKADQIKVPLLIGQGANDPRVKQAEADQIVEAMRKANKPVEYIVFTDEGHGFARPQNNLFFNAKTEEFLAKYLGGRAEPATEIIGHSGVIK